MGGIPEVKWGLYDDHIIHVRTTHVPRFEVEMSSKESLFSKISVTYNDFSVLSVHEKMDYIRTYARSRLEEGERLWWLEDVVEQEHSLPMQVRLYMNLNNEEKKRLRGEAALLCPQIVKSSRTRNKYNDAALYLLTYRGVLCPQARDLFSTGSVAIPDNTERGGIYIQRALKNIESEMIHAATYLEEALFVEYWGFSVDPNQRINEWLRLADTYAQTWKPSDSLFTINSG